jgi:hypothetical protein
MSAKPLALVLERFAAIAQSAMDSGPPIDPEGMCRMCLMQVEEPPADRPIVPIVDHDPSECGWWIARNQVSQSDVNEVRRLAHVLRYDGTTAPPQLPPPSGYRRGEQQ